MQKSVVPARNRQRIPQNEIDFILKKAKTVECGGRTIKGIKEMAEDKSFDCYLDAKYPSLDKQQQLRRLRDIVRKYNI